MSKPEGRRSVDRPKCDGLMTWRKILERWELVAREETNGNLSWGRSRFFKDPSAIGNRYMYCSVRNYNQNFVNMVMVGFWNCWGGFKTCTIRRGIMKFCILTDLRRMNNF
jgi:hypothetical protein